VCINIYNFIYHYWYSKEKKHQERISNKQQNNDKKINLTNKLNYIQLSPNCYYTDFLTQKSEQTNKYP